MTIGFEAWYCWVTVGSSCIEVLHGFSLSVKCCMNIRSDKAVLNYNLLFSDGDGGSCSGGGGGGSSPVFHLPADFFHPAAAAHPGSPGSGVSPGDRGPSRLASPASWASLRSPGANSRPLSSQVLWTNERIHVCLCAWMDGWMDEEGPDISLSVRRMRDVMEQSKYTIPERTFSEPKLSSIKNTSGRQMGFAKWGIRTSMWVLIWWCGSLIVQYAIIYR